jgi:hypothetical protein
MNHLFVDGWTKLDDFLVLHDQMIHWMIFLFSAGRLNSMRFKAALEGKPSLPPQLMKQGSVGLLKGIPSGPGPRPILKQALAGTSSNGSQQFLLSGSESPASTSAAAAAVAGLTWTMVAQRQDSLRRDSNGKPRLKRQIAIQDPESDLAGFQVRGIFKSI